ncbi:PhnB protein [Chitinophaga sp. W3I9]|uniref:VOC family protein n=1 Tax=unclassified Chitinophaga TaxID=2619133 RepID=UPI003D1FE4DE
MATTNTYITFNGTCEEAFNYYKLIFGGDFGHIVRYSELPANQGYQVTQANKALIMHISLPIGMSVLMGCDADEQGAASLIQGNNFCVSVSAENKAEAQKIFSGLAQYGQIAVPLAIAFWGDLFGMVTDQFGINWTVSFDAKNNSSLK